MIRADGKLLAGIEAGGTKFVLAVGTAPDAITARQVIPTREPAETLAEAAEWFAKQGAIGALGIASFGPLVIDRRSPAWGRIGRTPKPGWENCDLAGYFARRLAVPIGLDTDVNGAALAEFSLGAGRGTSGMAYITVGTGIGGGLVINGDVVRGAGHPEMGHYHPRRNANDRGFAGHCPYHGDCLEGLASGPAILARWGADLSQLPPGHEAHNLVSGYLAQLCHALFACTATERIVLGGGVMKASGLVASVAAKVRMLDCDYLPGSQLQSVVSPELGEASGITGALLLASRVS